MIPGTGPGRRRLGQPLRLAVVADTALAAGAGGAAIAVAGSRAVASSSGRLVASPSPSASRPGYAARGPGRGFFGGVGRAAGAAVAGAGVAGALHGESVVPADGFTEMYRVTNSTLVDAQRDGIGSVKDGRQVSVLTTEDGGTATATHIEDLSLLLAGYPVPSGNGSGSMPG
jgi:hypothetical protein